MRYTVDFRSLYATVLDRWLGQAPSATTPSWPELRAARLPVTRDPPCGRLERIPQPRSLLRRSIPACGRRLVAPLLKYQEYSAVLLSGAALGTDCLARDVWRLRDAL